MGYRRVLTQKHLDAIHQEKNMNTKDTQAWGWEDEKGIIHR